MQDIPGHGQERGSAGWSIDDAAGPRYIQIRTALEQSLARGEFPLNRAIPSSRHLSSLFGVSRNTVSSALQELTAMGLLVSKPRSGLYPVAGTAAPPPLGGIAPVPILPVRTERRGGEAAIGPQLPGTLRPAGEVDWDGHLLKAADPWGEKSVSDPDYLDFPYPFLPGQIDPGSFPVRAWLRAVTRVFDPAHIRYGVYDAVDADDPLLVEALANQVLPAKGISAKPEQILITGGVQQALTLLSGALLDSGRTMAMESPGYIDAARIAHRTGAGIRFFPVDQGGVLPDYSSDFDLLYVTPSHQHPTNVTLRADRRHDMLRQAGIKDFLIIEDDFDSEIRYRGSPTPPLRATDRSGRVVYLGTFSKFLAPALRLGYVVAEPPLIEELRERRYLSNKHPSGSEQRALGLFIASGDYHQSLRKHRVELKRKWETVAKALEEHFPWSAGEPPSGGLSYWITGPEDFDAGRMAARARELGVLVMPGSKYYLDQSGSRNTFRLGLNSIPQARIVPGIRLLAQAVRETQDPGPAAP